MPNKKYKIKLVYNKLGIPFPIGMPMAGSVKLERSGNPDIFSGTKEQEKK